MIFLILIFSLFLVPKIYAAPQVSILNYPSSVIIGDTFPITFNVFSAEIGTTYHYKIVGDTNADISIFPSCSNRYDDCLNLIILNSTNNLATASAKINIANSFNNLKIRIAQSDKHNFTFDSQFINIISFIPPEPTGGGGPTLFVSPTPTAPVNDSLFITEIMANPDTGQDEWIEIYNPSDIPIPLKNLCFYDNSSHSRCFSEDALIAPKSYFSHLFSSGFLNNDGDTVTFLNNSIIYPKSPKGLTYSLQTNLSWCFADGSQNSANNSCSSFSSSPSSDSNPVPPLLTLQFSPESVTAGDDFNLIFSLNSADPYSLRLISPFGSQYFPFSDFKGGYSWLTLPLSVSKKIPSGKYPLSFHLKKAGSSHLFDYQLGELNIKTAISTPKVSNSKILGVSTYSCPLCVDNSATVNYFPASTLKTVLPDANFFSWPFLFAGSILFLSPLLFPKLYAA